MRPISGFDRARRKYRFQAAVVTANAEPALRVDSDMSEVPARASHPAQHRPIQQDCTANSSAECQHHYVSPAARGAPEHFGKQRSACIIFRANGHIGGDYVAKEVTLEELQVTRRALNTA